MRRLACAVIVLVCSTLLVAQSKLSHRHAGATSPPTYKLLSINITGTKRYTPKEVIASTGLRIGQEVTEQDFKRASQKLGETGAFNEITYSYSYSSEGANLEIQLADNDQLIPVYFDNFVWFSDQELMEGLRRHVPLFKNRLPVGGPLADELADRLNTMLAGRGVAGHAHYLRFSDSPDSPIQSFLYSVDGADITIRNVDFPGASPSQLPILHDIARKKIEEGEYLRSKLEAVANVALRPIYLRQGYLKAAFGEAQAQVVSMSPKETVVDVKLPVEEGPQYKLDKIVLAGNTIFPADQLRALIHIELNQPPDVVQLEDDLHAVQKLYGSRGYLKAVVTSQPEFNDSEGRVTYKLQVKEGDLYRLAEVDIEGFDEKTAARLREEWKLREGDPYDSSYPQRFFQDAAADMPASNRWAMKVDESLNDKDKTVDVTLRFSPE